MGWYDTAQICLNGHVITDSYGSAPEFRRKFCKECGSETTTKCTHCQTDIQGHYESGLVGLVGRKMKAPKFCHECGKPYPWTGAKVEAAKAIADEIEGLCEGERSLLKASIDQIVTDTPQTEVGVIRFKKYAARASKETIQAMRDVLVDIVSETVSKSIWGK